MRRLGGKCLSQVFQAEKRVGLTLSIAMLASFRGRCQDPA